MALQIVRAFRVPPAPPRSPERPAPPHDPRHAAAAPTRLALLTPGPGESLTVGQAVLIRWQTSCVPGLLLYRLQLSLDGGLTYSRDIAPLLDGQECCYLWTPSDDMVTAAARLRLTAIHWGEASSNGSFAILPRARLCGPRTAAAFVTS
ncbi:MAG: hypothetical protein AB7N91_26360 [Candidatus Tectimicrobiota bacterium]